MEPTPQGKIAVVIPFFNEERTITKIITDTIPYADIIIAVNDGSTDSSVHNIPPSPKVTILNSEMNSGKGSALHIGLKQAISSDCDYVITLDADLQHPPEYIPKFIHALKYNKLVIGCRYRDSGNMPIHRKMSNKITSWMLTRKTGVRFKDSQSGFRGFSKHILGDILPSEPGYEAETEMLIKAALCGYSIGEITIPTIYTGGGSKMRYLPAIAGFLRVILKKY